MGIYQILYQIVGKYHIHKPEIKENKQRIEGWEGCHFAEATW